MLHPLLHVLATRPHLIADHVEAYAELVGDEVGKASTALVRRVALYAAAGISGAMGVIFAGIAVMLWGSLPSDGMPMAWLLILVPAVPLIGAGVCLAMAMAKSDRSGFQKVKEQFTADMFLLREVGATS